MLFAQTDTTLFFLSCIAVAAVLYSSVGHGGASGYLAVMALFGTDPAMMKPAALTMNVFVTLLVLARLSRAGHFDWKLFAPFIIASMPMAFLGGAWTVDSSVYSLIVGIALLLATLRMWWQPDDDYALRKPALLTALVVGGALGLLSGLTGVGGGIFLSPLLLMFHWTRMRGSAAIAAAFILLNSLAGLAGYATTGLPWPDGMVPLVIAATAGAMLGSELGARRLSAISLRRLLGLVLAVAGIKMIASA